MKRKELIESEHSCQCAIFEWSKVMSVKHPELKYLSGSLNGVRLTIGQAMKAKKVGMVKGYPDIFLPVSKMGFHGLFIELKRKKGGKTSPAQYDWIDFLVGQGYHATVCYGKSDAIWEIRQYLGIK